MRRPQTTTHSTMLSVLDDDNDVLDDDAAFDDADLDDADLDDADSAWLLDDTDEDDDEGQGDEGDDIDADDATGADLSLVGNDWLKDDDGLDPFSVAFAGVDVERLAQAMLDQGALDPARAVATDRRHRVSRHPATRRPGRR